MPRSRAWTDDTGSASLEFVTVGMVLLVPLVYLVLTVSAVQAAAFAVEGAARQAARVFVQSPDLSAAESSAQRALDFALADNQITTAARLAVQCEPVPGECFTRGGLVTVTVDLSVPLPFAPSVLVEDFPLAVPLHAAATEQVSRFWGSK